MSKLLKTGKRNKRQERVDKYREIVGQDLGVQGRLAMIQELIPLGLKAVEDALQEEVTRWAGARYSREGNFARWGANCGSVYLGGEKHSVRVPRVRDLVRCGEIPLETYHRLQNSRTVDDRVLGHLLNGISTRKYERVAGEIPTAFGLGANCVSQKFIRASAKKLKELQERPLGGHDIVAIFMDGKTFAENEIILALGVSMKGEKMVLGFIETGTENQRVVKEFVEGLEGRGLDLSREILWILDGSKGLQQGIRAAQGERAVIQRCQWHKRENVVGYLPKSRQAEFRRRLTTAYEQPSYEKAKEGLDKIKRELKLMNQSAVASLEEGQEETLTLHRLGLFEKLGCSFKTTNCIETLNNQLRIYTGRVCRWKNSNQRQRWVASAILEIEPRLRNVRGYRNLKELREAMQNEQQKAAA